MSFADYLCPLWDTIEHGHFQITIIFLKVIIFTIN